MDQADQSENKILSKKNIIVFLLIGILVLAIPFGVNLVKRATQLPTQATSEVITFEGPGVNRVPSPAEGQPAYTTTSDKVKVVLNYGEAAPSPTSSPAGPTSTLTPSPSASVPTSTLTPSPTSPPGAGH